MRLIIIDGDLSSADDLEMVSLHYECCRLIDTDAQNIRVSINHIDQFIIPLGFVPPSSFRRANGRA